MTSNPFSLIKAFYAILIFALFGLATACGPDNQADEVVNVRMEAGPKTLHALLSTSGYTQYVAARIFLSLGDVDPQTLAIVPMMIKEIPSAGQMAEGPDKGRWYADFEILEAAAWDDGSPVTAADVLFTLKAILLPGLQESKVFEPYFKLVTKIEPDPNNLKKFRVWFSDYYILSVESLCQFPIYPAFHYDPKNRLGKFSLSDLQDPAKAESIAADPDVQAFIAEFKDPKFATDKNAISGSGPYRLESLTEQLVVLVKKENWWGKALAERYPALMAEPAKLVYKITGQDDALENMLKNEEVDVAVSINPAKFLEWQKNETLKAKYDFLTGWISQYNRIHFNVGNPKLADKRVRQALAQAVDYDYLINTVVMGLGERTTGPINPSRPYYAKDIQPYLFNVQKARELLTSAGWTDSDGDGVVDKMLNGKKTPLTLELLSTNAVRTSELASNSVRQTMQQIGVKVNIVAIDVSKLGERTRARNFEMALYAGAQFPGWADLYQSYHSQSPDNRGAFANAKADSLITAIRTGPDPAQRQLYYQEIQRLLHEECPEIYLYTPKQRYIVSKKFNYVISANRPGYYEHMFKVKP